MVKYETTKGQLPTEEQLREVEEASQAPIVYDDDCPELSKAMLKALRCVAKQRDRKEA